MKSKLIIRFTLVFLVLLSCTKQIDDSILDVDIEELLVEVDPILSTENTISSVDDVYLNGDVVESFDYEIIESDKFIRIVLPSGSNVSSVSIDFTMAENASLASSISGLNFTGTGIKLISVVAENGDTRTYALKIIVTGGVDPMPSPSEIISVTSVTASGIVVIPVEPAMFSDNSINVLLPAGTPLTDINFEFEITENSFLLDDATNLSFESGATNEVRLESEEGEVRTYTITVELESSPDLSDENDIIKITATIGDAPNVTIIDEREAPEFDGSRAIIMEVPFKTAISDVDLEFELSEFATLQIDDITTGLDFTGGVVKMFTVIAQDGSEQTYGIGVVIADPTEREALIEMYNGPEGIEEEFQWDLSEGSDIGLWHGVSVNTDGNVIGILGNLEGSPTFNLDNNLQFLPFLETINGTDSGLRLPPELDVDLPNLKSISIDVGSQSVIPEWITKQTSITALRFFDTGLISLPENLTDLINLVRLDFENNKLESLPASIADLPNLVTLDIRDNDTLTSIPQAICDWGEIDGHTLSKDDATICGDLSSENKIIDVQLFTEAGVEIPQTANINIDNLSNEVTIAVPTNTDITALRVNLDISDGASVIFDSTDAFDFTTPESFTVTAQDGVNAVWMVNVILDAAITPGEAFITTWTGTEVTIPINTAFTYNYNVDWDNDGILDEFGITGEITHSFTTTGPHTIQITGEFPAINFFSASDSVIGLEQWGIEEWLGVVNAFRTCENIVFNATDVPDMTRVTDMSGMFLATGLANPDVTEWDVSSVTTMEGMFSLAVSADPDVSAWDVSSVVNMRNMFNGATSADPDISTWDVTNVVTTTNMFINSGITNPDLSNWNIENVNTMDRMFDGVTLSTEVYDQLLIDLSTKTRNNNVSFHGGNSTYCSAEAAAARQALEDTGWTITDGGQATGCEPEATIVPGEAFITTWLTNEVVVPINSDFTYNYNVDWDNDGILDEFIITGAAAHTYDTTGPHTIQITGDFPAIEFGTDISRGASKIISLDQWGTGVWKSMDSAFHDCDNLEVPASDIPNLSQVTSMNNMFLNADKANPDVSNWDVSSVVDMSGMFLGAKSADPNVSNWIVSNVTDMGAMFSGATSANPDVSNWDTRSVTFMTSMFSGATSADPNVSNWDVSNVAGMSTMFRGATSADPDVSLWNTTNVTNMAFMFLDATSANPDVSLWNTTNVTSMASMFLDATLANPDVNGWDTSNVTNMFNMFANSGITNADLSNWNIENVNTMDRMFDGVTLPTEVYDQLLIDLADKDLSPGIDFGGGNSTYCSAEAAAARQALEDTGWTITDLGPMADCQTTFPPEIQAQRDALLSMYNGNGLSCSTDFDTFWSEDTDMTEWEGVTLDTNGNVIGLSGDADCTPISNFNNSLGDLIYLQRISSVDGGFNMTTDLTLTNNLENLIRIDIESATVTLIPDWIISLPNLESLSLRNVGLNISIPSEIANIESLTSLSFIDNSILEIPESIAFMPNLERFIVTQNRPLLTMPSNICDRNDDDASFTLTIDESVSCALYTPEVQAQRDALLSMYTPNGRLDWAEDTDMGDWSGISADINGNVTRLILIDEYDGVTLNNNLSDLTYLTELTYSENSNTLTSIPDVFEGLTALRILNLEQNNITSLPASIASLINLELIDLTETDVTSLPDSLCERVLNGDLIIEKDDGRTEVNCQ